MPADTPTVLLLNAAANRKVALQRCERAARALDAARHAGLPTQGERLNEYSLRYSQALRCGCVPAEIPTPTPGPKPAPYAARASVASPRAAADAPARSPRPATANYAGAGRMSAADLEAVAARRHAARVANPPVVDIPPQDQRSQRLLRSLLGMAVGMPREMVGRFA